MADKNMAWGDESIRMVGNPPFYMLGACLTKGLTATEQEMMYAIKPAGSKKLHWRDMSRKQQRASLEVLASIGHFDIVVTASPLEGKRQERARRKCLGALLQELQKQDIDCLVLESRKLVSDKRDIDYVEYARNAHAVKGIRVEHESGSFEPRLWLIDQVLGAMGDYITQKGEWEYWKHEWEALLPRVIHKDISL